MPVALYPLIATFIVCQIHKGEESCFFCQKCKFEVCLLCIIEDHRKHNFVITEVAYKEVLETCSKFKQSIHDKATHRRVVKVDLEAVLSSIDKSCEQVCSVYHLK